MKRPHRFAAGGRRRENEMRSYGCSKCQGSMTEGFVIDEAHGSKSVSTWIEGAPVRSWLGIKTKGKAKHEIQTWRCTRCGLLESYARG